MKHERLTVETPGKSKEYRIWIVRLLVLIVFGWNILCAIQFIAQPDVYAPAYQLSGPAGQVALQGIGVAFLMWNTTYPLFIINPRKWPVLGVVILSQQIIGLIGESLILMCLPATGFILLANSITRFILFDAAGLILIALALLVLRTSTRKILL